MGVQVQLHGGRVQFGVFYGRVAEVWQEVCYWRWFPYLRVWADVSRILSFCRTDTL